MNNRLKLAVIVPEGQPDLRQIENRKTNSPNQDSFLMGLAHPTRATWRYRLSVRTSGFQPEKQSSTLCTATIQG